MATLGQRLGIVLLVGSVTLLISPAADARPTNLTSGARVEAAQYYYAPGYYGRPYWHRHHHWHRWYRDGYRGGPRHYGYYHRHRYWGRY